MLAGLATDYSFLLVARIIQAVGGAAVPGLGMTLVSRAYGPESRGMVLGIIAATIGVGSAAGPLLGGLLSELFGWRSIFFVTAGAVLTIPYTIKALPKFEQRIVGSLDLLGGMSFSIMGANLAPLIGLPILLALAHQLSPL